MNRCQGILTNQESRAMRGMGGDGDNVFLRLKRRHHLLTRPSTARSIELPVRGVGLGSYQCEVFAQRATSVRCLPKYLFEFKLYKYSSVNTIKHCTNSIQCTIFFQPVQVQYTVYTILCNCALQSTHQLKRQLIIHTQYYQHFGQFQMNSLVGQTKLQLIAEIGLKTNDQRLEVTSAASDTSDFQHAKM